MQYIDPYDFLGLNVQAPIEVDPALLARARKKLLADFQLAENDMLEWQGEEIGLSQALAMLDRMEDGPTRLNYWRIRQSAAVMDFLRNGRIVPALIQELRDLRQAKGCFELVAPFWIPAISHALRTAMERADVEGGKQALAMVRAGHLAEDTEVWRGVTQWASQQAAAMHSSNRGPSTKVDQAALERYSHEVVFLMLNQLPDRYEDLRNAYASALVHLAWAYYQVTKKIAVAWSAVKDVGTLDISIETHRALRPIIDALRKIAWPYDPHTNFDSIFSQIQSMPQIQMQSPPKPEGGKSAWPTLLGLFMILCFAVLMLRILNGSGDHGHSHLDYNQFKMPDISYDPHSFDGLMKFADQSKKSAERLYDSLWEQHASGKIGDTGKPQRPEHGTRVYRFHTSPQLFRTEQLVVQNRSSKDMVLMIEESKGHQLVEAVYLRSKGDAVSIGLASEVYFFRCYTGKDWVPMLTRFDRMQIPGFSKNVTFVGSHPDLYEDKSATLAPMTLKSMSQVPEGHAANRLTFNGKVFEWGW